MLGYTKSYKLFVAIPLLQNLYSVKYVRSWLCIQASQSMPIYRYVCKERSSRCGLGSFEQGSRHLMAYRNSKI